MVTIEHRDGCALIWRSSQAACAAELTLVQLLFEDVDVPAAGATR